MSAGKRAPALVAAAALAVYGLWAVAFVARDSPTRLARPGLEFLEREGESERIEALRNDAVLEHGYDGQFFLYWALDPGDASPYIDRPAAYRLSRILYPALAYAAAAGRPALVPAALLLVNLAAIALGTFALAYVLARRGASPWWSLLFAGFPGMFLAVSHDLSEPLAYALVAAGLALLERDGVGRPWRAAVLFGLAGVTRETTLIFPLVLAACGALGIGERATGRGVPGRASAFLVVAVAPYVALKVALFAIYESWGFPYAEPSFVPFGSFVSVWPDGELQVTLELVSVVLPTLIALVLAVSSVRRATPSVGLLAAHGVFLVALLPDVAVEDYIALGRLASGAVVAFLLAVPAITGARTSRLVWLPLVLFLLPWPAVGALSKPL